MVHRRSKTEVVEPDNEQSFQSEISDIVQQNERILERSRTETTMRIPPATVLRMLVMCAVSNSKSKENQAMDLNHQMRPVPCKLRNLFLAHIAWPSTHHLS